ncbi:MAG: hypothetical protein IJ341_04660 [Bacteroidales bacterium]|nr:hypothetical protein [Bacteroidales bacterium]MBQ7818967.1 hypothetical protein [Bacteroidales bacterium]
MKKIKINPNILGAITIVAALSILTATIMFLYYPTISMWLLGVGGLCLIFVRFFRNTDGMTKNQQRACRIELFSALLITASAWFIYLQQREWIALLLSAAILQLYATYIAGKKDKTNKK